MLANDREQEHLGIWEGPNEGQEIGRLQHPSRLVAALISIVIGAASA